MNDCPSCAGRGYSDTYLGPVVCSRCHGKREVPDGLFQKVSNALLRRMNMSELPERQIDPPRAEEAVECPVCEGEGVTTLKPECPACKGEGVVSQAQADKLDSLKYGDQP